MSDAIVRLNNERDIKKYLPHAGWAMALDSAIYNPSCPDEITAQIHLLEDAEYFHGHFPGNPVLPGHWQLEFFCLAAALLCKLKFPDTEGFPTLTEFGRMKFKRIVRPLDDIEVIANFIDHIPGRGGSMLFRLSGEIKVGGKTASKIEEVRGTLT